MGRISNFYGQMHTEISFLVDGKAHRATMLKEKSRGVLGSSKGDVEKVTIRLELEGKSICVESYMEGEGQRIIRYVGRQISIQSFANLNNRFMKI